MTTLDKVLAARLVGGLQSSSIERIGERVFIRLREIRIEKTGFTLMADGNLSAFVDGTDRVSLQTVLDGGIITVTLPSAYIEVKIG